MSIGDIMMEALENEDGRNVKVVANIEILNVGNTPANTIEVFFSIDEAIYGEIFCINLEEESGRSKETRSFIAAGKSSNTTISRVWHVKDRDRLLAKDGSTIRIIFAVRYNDVFGEPCETLITSGTIGRTPTGETGFIADFAYDPKAEK